jgi:rod shape-determining protein MreD
MQKILFVTACVLIAFAVEFLIANMFGVQLVPEIDLILIVFFNLAFGIRFSIFTAVLAGLLHEGFGGQLFGIYLLPYVISAYLATVLRPYIYQPGSMVARLTLIAAVLSANFTIHLLLTFKAGPLNIPAALRYVYLPQLAVTLLTAAFIFPYMRKCVLKYFV